MRKELLEHSYRKKLSHIPSALSMLDYVDCLFSDRIITPDDYIVLGKPFGSQAYYLIWQKLGYLQNIENLNVGVKHDEVSFVDYSEETMGNALGVAAGIAMATTNRVWVNITDAALQMGNTLEALQFIGHHNLSNIFVTVDYNNAQVTGRTEDILAVEPVIQMCKNYYWWTQVVDGHNKDAVTNAFNNVVTTMPSIVFCRTRKGAGVREMENNIRMWHYRTIKDEQELAKLVNEL